MTWADRLDPEERRAAARACLGRLFRLGSRASEPGDVDEYERLRSVLLDLSDAEGFRPDFETSWARDRLKGAAGD